MTTTLGEYRTEISAKASVREAFLPSRRLPAGEKS